MLFQVPLLWRNASGDNQVPPVGLATELFERISSSLMGRCWKAMIKFMELAAIEAMGDDCAVINFFWAV
jgi:hypothetical protein